MTNAKQELATEQADSLLETLKSRFEKNMPRHQGLDWTSIEAKLRQPNMAKKLCSLYLMEETGGEPDVISPFPLQSGEKEPEFIFVDCSAESPAGRRSVCFDREGLESRKEHRPENSAMDLAEEIGIQLLSEEQYRSLQNFGKFDLKTSSWVATPPEIRKLGGAYFCDRRYDHVFLYHNGAQSYYAVRGFRGWIGI